jgi:hypothetical protein
MGLDGLSDLFRFYIDGVQANLVRKGYDRFDPGKSVVWNALQGFAQQLAGSGIDALSADAARSLLERYLYPPPASEHTRTFLFRLEDEGLLRRMPNYQGSTEDVSFTFQRFSDHFVAAAILQIVETPTNLAKAMRRGGNFAYLTQGTQAWRFAGVIEALMIQVPERFGVELALIDKHFTKDVRLPARGFIEGLKVRTPKSVTPTTVDIFEHLMTVNDHGEAYEALLELCSQPNHGLNGDYLHEQLMRMKMPDRDAHWSAFLFHQLDHEGPVSTLIDWARSVDVAKADTERLRLVASTLCWFFSTSDRRVRDQATKSVAHLFYEKPELIAPILVRFLAVDDPYIRERALAAAYGALLHFHDRRVTLRQAATAAYHVFTGASSETHAVIRDYARGIIELAAKRNALPDDIDLNRCRPPYDSPLIERWPTLSAIKKLESERGARDIVHSAVGFIGSKSDVTIAGDFGRYAMSRIDSHFSASRRQGSGPFTAAGEKQKFWTAVASVSKDVAALAELAKIAKQALSDSEQSRHWLDLFDEAPRNIDKEQGNPSAVSDHSRLLETFLASEAELKRSLPPELRKRYDKTSPYVGFRDDEIRKFPLARAQRWVAMRAVQLGWSQKKHGEIERNRDGGWDRHDHSIERIGKKYQWIAYWELVGYLSDHHWYLDWNNQQATFDRVDRFDPLDIDASFLLREGDAKIRGTHIAGSDLFSRNDTVERLVGEHSADLVILGSDPILASEYEGINFGRFALSLNPSRGEYDQSGTSGSFAAPEDWLLNALNLRPSNPQSMCFVTSANQPAFLDLRFPGEWDGAVVINADLLSPVLAAKGLSAVWIFSGEKDGGIGHGPGFDWSDKTDRRAFGGMWWLSSAGWEGSNWASPTGWNERASSDESVVPKVVSAISPGGGRRGKRGRTAKSKTKRAKKAQSKKATVSTRRKTLKVNRRPKKQK